MSPFGVSGLLAGVSALCFGLFVFFKGANRRIARLWAIFMTVAAIWGFCCYLISIARDATQAAYWWQFVYLLSVPWIAAVFFHFVCVFLAINRPKTIVINYMFALAFAFLLGIKRHFYVEWMFDSIFYVRADGIYAVYLAWWMSSILYSHYVMYSAYKVSSSEKRNQIKYFFLALGIGFTGGSLCYLPAFGIRMYPYGNFVTCLYPFIMSYAIYKHHLLDIRIVIQKTVLSLFALLIAIAGYIAFVAHFTHRAVLPLANFSIFTAILSLVMALFVFVKAPRRQITTMWILTCLSIAMWSFGFGMMTRSVTFEQCMFWQKWFLYVGSIMIPVLFLHFVGLLLRIDLKKVLVTAYSGAVLFEIINISGYLAGAKIKPPFNFYTDAFYPIYYLFTTYFFSLTIYAHWLLFRGMMKAGGDYKKQIQYVFVGTAVGFIGGCMTFPLSFNIHVFPIGAYLVVFYLVAITYAIAKHRLMDIDVALRKSLVYSVMTGTLTAIYLVVITQGAHFLQNYFGASTYFISVISACFITAIFLPLRSRVQSFVDRYFFRDWSERGEMVREVAAGFSHELKSPLAGLSMQAQLALAELQDVEDGKVAWLKALPKIKKEIEYLLNQSMDAARRIEAVRGVAEPIAAQIGPVEVPPVLDSGLAIFVSRLRQLNVQVRQDVPNDLPLVRSNEKQLEIVFINLIKNALDAMEGMKRDNHSLVLSGQTQNGSVLISVRDSGPGIAAKDVGRIFEPYYTTKGHKGTGMGLYLTQQIVRAHGGSLDVKSEEGKGTEFVVSLPKYSAEKAA